MNIVDKDGELLALILRSGEQDASKYFATKDEQEFQVASFNLDEDEEILRHTHPKQERLINSTSEVIIVIEGSLEVEIFDNNLTLCEKQEIGPGDVLALFGGGHGLKMLSKCKFVEVKQGPYLEDEDKIRF